MRLLVVEDETELAALVAAGLRKAGFVVDRFGTVAEAEAALADVSYDAVILDINLPDGDGLTLLKAIRRRRDPVPILLLTARDGLEDRVTGLDAGADDYVLKPFAFPELVARIHALLRRPPLSGGTVLTLGDLTLDPKERRALLRGEALALSRREVGLLELLLRRPGMVVTKQAMESGLYAFQDEIGSNALEVAVHRLRRKLADSGSRLQIRTLRGIGYLLSEDPS